MIYARGRVAILLLRGLWTHGRAFCAQWVSRRRFASSKLLVHLRDGHPWTEKLLCSMRQRSMLSLVGSGGDAWLLALSKY